MIDLNRAEMGYTDGYTDGYAWLSRSTGKNFKHPSVSGGYIPGGPWVFTAGYNNGTNKQKYEAWERISRKYHKDWMRGWVDGINKYVEVNNLGLPQVRHV